MPTTIELGAVFVKALEALFSLAMGYPRRLSVPADTRGIYHCVSRCVRRAFLCGVDERSGRSFEHRKYWIEYRILRLAEVFSVAIHAYAVMSNHVHLVIEVDPGAPTSWSDEEVAQRWLTVFGKGGTKHSPLVSRISTVASDPERIDVLRQRLGSLSWFMRALNEPIARRANREDDCTGRFWEGRFKCQALLDDAAFLACMAYVDLNPVRARIAESPEDSPHTSAHRRAKKFDLSQSLEPLATSIVAHVLDVSEAHYLQLLEWTTIRLNADAAEKSHCSCPSALNRLSLSPNQWLVQVPATESCYWRAVGSVQALLDHAQRVGCRWLRGIGFARHLMTLSDNA